MKIKTHTLFFILLTVLVQFNVSEAKNDEQSSTQVEVVHLNYISPEAVVSTIESLQLPDFIISSPKVKPEEKKTVVVSGQQTVEYKEEKTKEIDKREMGDTTKLNFVVLRGSKENVEIAKSVIASIDIPLKTVEITLITVDIAQEYSDKLTLSILPSFAKDNFATILNEQTISVLDGREGHIAIIGNSRPSGSKVNVESLTLTVEAKVTGEDEIVLKVKPILVKRGKGGREVTTLETVITLKDDQEYLLSLTKTQNESYDKKKGIHNIIKTKKTNIEGREIAMIIVPHIAKPGEKMDYDLKNKTPDMKESRYNEK